MSKPETMAIASSIMAQFSFDNHFETCFACGKPPEENKKLLCCRNCKCSAYHNVDCQQSHWKQGHKKECKILKQAGRPLAELVEHTNHDWWVHVDESSSSDALWRHSCQQWYQQDYLNAMEGFQRSLEPYDRAWQKSLKTNDEEIASHHNHESQQAWKLAKRLLFCAYCELDGNQIDRARNHLILAVSLLVHSMNLKAMNQQEQSLLDDAWMELMLSFEEVRESRKLARRVAHMAIVTGACGWKHPLQRPGYMVYQLAAIPFMSRSKHPTWCRVLEDNWQSIFDEYKAISQTKSLSVVGAGHRGSGQDDHRVVAAGSNWTEYVLFGTGSKSGVDDAPVTRRLLRQHVPDAVSLAQQGGGEVIFSRLAPGSHIQSHCGPTNFRWTAHLGLVVPTATASSSCQIRVGSRWHSWETGTILLFDDSFEHEVINHTEEERVVLLLRLWHPDLNQGTRDSALYDARQKKEKAIEERYHPPS
jgi:aspartyl/asparaginyl beta-hydroxylase (cupin superfamily)